MSAPAEPSYYPTFLDLRDRRVVVVGRGPFALEKVVGLDRAGAAIRLVGRELVAPLRKEADRLLACPDTRFELHERDYRPGDLEGAFLAFAERDAGTDLAGLFAEAERRQIFVNVQDVVPYCSLIAPSVVRRGDLQVAISTSGSAPALAVRLRERLENELGAHHADFLALARQLRPLVAERHPDFEDRRRRWYRLVDSDVLELLSRGEPAHARRRAFEIMDVVDHEASAGFNS